MGSDGKFQRWPGLKLRVIEIHNKLVIWETAPSGQWQLQCMHRGTIASKLVFRENECNGSYTKCVSITRKQLQNKLNVSATDRTSSSKPEYLISTCVRQNLARPHEKNALVSASWIGFTSFVDCAAAACNPGAGFEVAWFIVLRTMMMLMQLALIVIITIVCELWRFFFGRRTLIER